MIQDPKTMKSPITGGQVTLEWEWREMEFRKYEQEEIPNVSNGRMIRSIMIPKVFLDM